MALFLTFEVRRRQYVSHGVIQCRPVYRKKKIYIYTVYICVKRNILIRQRIYLSQGRYVSMTKIYQERHIQYLKVRQRR